MTDSIDFGAIKAWQKERLDGAAAEAQSPLASLWNPLVLGDVGRHMHQETATRRQVSPADVKDVKP